MNTKSNIFWYLLCMLYLPTVTLPGLCSSYFPYWSSLVHHTVKCPLMWMHLEEKLKEMQLYNINYFYLMLLVFTLHLKTFCLHLDRAHPGLKAAHPAVQQQHLNDHKCSRRRCRVLWSLLKCPVQQATVKTTKKT